MLQQAEDVMGSLLKEYLNVVKEQVDDPNISESSNDVSELSAIQEPENGERASMLSHCSENNNADNDVSEVSACQEPENGEIAPHSSENNTANNDVSEGCACQEPENGERASHWSENNNAEIGSEDQKGSGSENENTSSQQFKNVVAIVDPPRAGLHPTVRIILYSFSTINMQVITNLQP